MHLSQLHFARPEFLWAVLAIPVIAIVFFFCYRPRSPLPLLEKFIDAHLLPHLLVGASGKQTPFWRTLVLWCTAWLFLTFALAGPRWSFKEVETFSKDQSLVILLDLSESMNAKDVKPSRLVRAKQKIEDILNLSKGVKIGLIAFAADSHMITPLTEDKETIRHLLPSLGTDLVFVKGSKLSAALEMASVMLEAEPGHNKSLLIISDGGFEDASAIVTAKKLTGQNVVIHAMGVGTSEGAPVLDHDGTVIKKNGNPVLSKLEKERLHEISRAGNGRYLEVHYSDHEEAQILSELEKRAETQLKTGKKNQLWDEHFYLLVIPVLPFILFWFRRGYVFIGLLLFLTPLAIHAAPLQEFDLLRLKNTEQLGKQAFEEGDYEKASETFLDYYRKGVACYKAGNFAKAEEMFSQSFRKEVACNAAYNLGNTLVQQQKLKEAIAAYEEVLKRWPDHEKAKENLELVKKMLQQQQQDSSDSENGDNKQQQEDSSDAEKGENKQQQEDSSDAENGDNKQQQEDSDQAKRDQSQQKQTKDTEASDDDEEKPVEKPEENGAQESDPQGGNKEQKTKQAEVSHAKEEGGGKSAEDQEADFWLNRMTNDPKKFLKNKFYIESKKNGTTEKLDPW